MQNGVRRAGCTTTCAPAGTRRGSRRTGSAPALLLYGAGAAGPQALRAHLRRDRIDPAATRLLELAPIVARAHQAGDTPPHGDPATLPTVFGTATITLEQFVALQCIILNELGGSMTPVSEFTGPAGLAYLYNATGKASYNTGPLSHSALVCFSDPVFLAAHQGKAFGTELANTQDPVWGGNVYPADRYPTDMTAAGMIAEADFCKFRGRGLIQTTWRTGYLPLIGFVQGYTGSQATVLGYTTRWAGMSRDDVASSSSNADWDDLYQHSDYLIPSKAINLHSQGGGGYLAISTDQAVRTGTGQGSFHNMGKKISGSSIYGTTFQGRCAQILDSLPA